MTLKLLTMTPEEWIAVTTGEDNDSFNASEDDLAWYVNPLKAEVKAQATEVARLTEERDDAVKAAQVLFRCEGYLSAFPCKNCLACVIRTLQNEREVHAATKHDLSAQLAEAQRTVITIERSRKVACKAASRLGAKITRLETQLAEAQQEIEKRKRAYAELLMQIAREAGLSSPVSDEAEIIAEQEARWERGGS